MSVDKNLDKGFLQFFKGYNSINDEKEKILYELIKHLILVLVGALTLFVALNSNDTTCSQIADIIYIVTISSSVLCILLSLILLYSQVQTLNYVLQSYRETLNKYEDEKDLENIVVGGSKIRFFDCYLYSFFFCYVIFFVGIISYGLVTRFTL